MIKRVRIVPCLLLAFFLEASVHAYVSELPGLRTAVAELLAALEGQANPDAKAVSSLNKALTALDKSGGTAISADLKALASVATSISKSSVSNQVGAALEGTVDAYIGMLSEGADQTEVTLAGAFPSGLRKSAEKNLALAKGYLEAAEQNGNLPAAAKLLTKAETKLRVAASSTERALAMPPPPASFTATVTASEEGSFKFTPVKESVQGVRDTVLGNIVITAVYVKAGTITVTRFITITLPNVPEGTTTYNLASDANALATYTTLHAKVILKPTPGTEQIFAEGYIAESGTVTITRNAASKTAFGTFEFSGPGGTDGHSATVSGSFSLTHN